MKRIKPELGQTYFYIRDAAIYAYKWDDMGIDRTRFAKGNAFVTHAAAVAKVAKLVTSSSVIEEESDSSRILHEIEESDEYINFRKHYTKEIKSFLTDHEGRFVMTHALAGPMIMDVTEMIKKLGYEIIKK